MPIGGGGLTGSPGGVTHTLQADFSGTAFGGTPTWTDITAYWLSGGVDPGGSPAAISFGRQDQSSQVEASTVSYVLNNVDGRFTQGRATLVGGGANPYYPNVKRNIRMRQTIYDGTTTTVLADGLVDSWDLSLDPDTGVPKASVSLTDSFGRLSATSDNPVGASTAAAALRSIFIEEMLVDAPIALYPLDEAAGSSGAGNVSTTTQPAATLFASAMGGTSTFGYATVSPAPWLISSPPSAVAFTATTDPNSGGGVRLPVNVPNPPFAIAFRVKVDAANGGAPNPIFVGGVSDSAGNQYVLISWDTTTGWTATFPNGARVDGGGLGGRVSVVNDGKFHTLLVGMSNSTTPFVFADGAAQPNVTTASSAVTLPKTQMVFFGAAPESTKLVRGGSGQVAGIAIYGSAPSLARHTAHHTAWTTGFAGESTAARWARLGTYRPNPGVSSTGTVGTVGSEDTAGQSLGDAFTSVAVAEGGVIDSHRGVITLIGRSNNRNPTASVTLRADHGEVDLPTAWRDDTQGLVNDVTVTRVNGATQRATNAASITADGSAQQSVTANVNSDRDAADMAGWMVAVGTQEALSSPTLTVNLYTRADPVLTMAVCGLKTFDVVTLTGLPAQAPASSMSFQVQGGTYTVGADTFTVQLNTTPVPPNILRADATADTYTLLDSTNVIGW